jgi:hypothetical protein
MKLGQAFGEVVFTFSVKRKGKRKDLRRLKNAVSDGWIEENFFNVL